MFVQRGCFRSGGSCTINLILRRSLKTKFTVVHHLQHTKQQNDVLLGQIKLIDKVVNTVTRNKNILHKDKYKKTPQLISGNDYNRLDYVIKNYIKSMELDNAIHNNHRSNESKLGMIVLQLLRECGDGIFHPLTLFLVSKLLNTYNTYPYKETLGGIILGLDTVLKTLNQNKIMIQKPDDIVKLIDSLVVSSRDQNVIKQVLQKLDYKLYSDDIVRVIPGKKMHDEIELTKGWKFLTGIVSNNEPYLRSLDIPKKKLISLQKDTLVLVCDGYLQDMKQILPTIAYMNKIQKSVLLLISGECSGEVMAAITINNNKNKRNGKAMKTIVMKYNPKEHNDMSIQENQYLLQFLKLPKGMQSIFSSEYSETIPSTVSEAQYFGHIESLKATTGEALLYNDIPNQENNNNKSQLHTTIDLKVGGESELEIDIRRNQLDHIINDVICEGLSSGFVTGFGVSLVKTIPVVSKLLDSRLNIHDINTRIGIEAVLDCLSQPMETSLKNEFGTNVHRVSQCISKTITEPNPTLAYLPLSSQSGSSHRPNSGEDLASIGILEPYSKIQAAIQATSHFLSLFTSCNTVITSIMETPPSK